MPANPYYLLQVLVRGVTVDVRLNDVPAFVHHTGEEMTSSGEYNSLIVNGANGLKTTIDLLPGADEAPPDAKVEVALAVAKKGQTIDDGKKLLSFEWSPPKKEEKEEKDEDKDEEEKKEEEQEEPAVTYPVIDLQATGIQWPHGPWAWQACTPLTSLGDARRQGVRTEVEALHAALQQRKTDTVIGMMDLRTREVATAHYVGPATLTAGLRNALQEAFADPQWGMQALEADDLQMDLVGSGRVVWVRSKDLGYPIRSAELSTGGSNCQRILMSDIKGKWTIVR